MEKILSGASSSCSKKGQIFLAAAIVIVVGLVIMKSIFSLYAVVEEKRHEDTMLNEQRISNLKHEYEYAVGIAAMQADVNSSGILYLANFSNYIRSETTDVRVFYVFMHANSTSHKYSVTAGNFLKDKINLTVNTTDSPLGVNYELNDKANKTWEFQGIADEVNITVTYDYRNSQVRDMLAISTNKNFTSGFFDIIIQNDVFLEKKVVYKVLK